VVCYCLAFFGALAAPLTTAAGRVTAAAVVGPCGAFGAAGAADGAPTLEEAEAFFFSAACTCCCGRRVSHKRVLVVHTVCERTETNKNHRKRSQLKRKNMSNYPKKSKANKGEYLRAAVFHAHSILQCLLCVAHQHNHIVHDEGLRAAKADLRGY
jgi:hypothetical protein